MGITLIVILGPLLACFRQSDVADEKKKEKVIKLIYFRDKVFEGLHEGS